MKHFIFTTFDHKPPRNGSGMCRTMSLYRIIRGEPVFIGKTTDTFKQGRQMAVEMLEEKKLLPRAAFERHSNGAMKLHYSSSFQDAGFCTIHEV